MPLLVSAGTSLVNHHRYRDFVRDHLLLLHSITRASVPIMDAAVAAIDVQQASTGVDRAVREYFVRHIPEERGHDDWVAEDLTELGCTPGERAMYVPLNAVAAAVGAQYYWIHHHRPIAILGYIAVLEGYTATPHQIEDLIRRTGLPRAIFRTMLKHSEIDLQHSRELDALLDRLALSKMDIDLICKNASMTIERLADAFQHICRVAVAR